MKKLFLLFIVAICTLSMMSCKKNKNTFKSVMEIKQSINTFDITANFNGISFELIKTSKGYYVAEKDKDIYLFYDKANNVSYRVDNNNQTKTLVIGNYDFSKYLENVYYILTYHTSKDEIAIKILSLNKKDNRYLDREVTEYYREKNGISEHYYIDKQTGACLYFSIDSGDQKMVCKIDKLVLGDDFLTPYFTYDSLKMADPSEFKNKNTILSYFTEEYDLKMKFKDSNVHLIKATDGFFSLLENTKQTSAIFYSNVEDTWYNVDLKAHTKSITNVEESISEIENNFLKLLTDYIDNIDCTFFVKENQNFLDDIVNIYQRDITTDGILYSEKYYIDMSTGICLSKNINLSGNSEYFEVISLDYVGDVSEYLEYEVVKKPISYDKWPVDHEYLVGIPEIKYGEFELAYDDTNELTIVYQNITNSAFNVILNNMKSYGFTINSDEEKAQDATNQYIYYFYEAKREDELGLKLEYVGTTLTIILGPNVAA